MSWFLVRNSLKIGFRDGVGLGVAVSFSMVFACIPIKFFAWVFIE